MSTPVYLFTCTTGGEGNVGGKSLEAFTQQCPDAKVLIGARNIQKAKSMYPKHNIIQLDLHDPSTYEKALRGVSHVFLGEPNIGGMSSEELLEAFVKAVEKEQGRTGKKIQVVRFIGGGLTDETVEMARKAGTDALNSHMTAVKVFGKAREEGRITVAFLDAESWFFQNYSGLYQNMVKKGEIAVCNGDVALPCVDTRDLGDVVAKIFRTQDWGNKDIVITGAVQLTTTEWAKLISEATGKAVKASTDENTCRKHFKELEEQAGEGFWEEMRKFYKFEELAGQQGMNLHPETFEKLVGKKHRTPEQFCKEMAATNVWSQ